VRIWVCPKCGDVGDPEFCHGKRELLRHPPTERVRVGADAPRSSVERQIAGALRDAINQHGPLTAQTLGSATKRVYKTLHALYDFNPRATDGASRAAQGDLGGEATETSLPPSVPEGPRAT
jgi:hypothetical protein